MRFKVHHSKLFMQLIEATEIERNKLKVFLNPKAKKYYFHPLYKKKLWDGRINFFKQGDYVSVGLWKMIKDFCVSEGFKLRIDGIDDIVDKNFDFNGFYNWIDEYNKTSKDKPYDFQVDAAVMLLKYRRGIIESATGSGKTLMMFLVMAYLLDTKTINKIMVIVPAIGLLNQSVSKFVEYDNNILIGKEPRFRMQVYGGGENEVLRDDVNVVVGTFHTLTKMDKVFLSNFDCVIVDESHRAKTKSISDIIKRLDKCHYRFGLSGTALVDTVDAESMGMQEQLGPLIKKIKSYRLQRKGYVAKVEIEMHRLSYLPNDQRLMLRKARQTTKGTQLLTLEKHIARSSKDRFKHIINVCKNEEGNGLVLFTDVKGKYGKKIADVLQKQLPEFMIHYIDGSVDIDKRDEIREAFNDESVKHILVASFMTTSTGIDIPQLDYLVMTESYKGLTIVLQSIGRTLRIRKGKKYARVIDLFDDYSLSQQRSFKNHLLKHAEERAKIYEKEKYPYKVINFEYRKDLDSLF